MQGPARDRSRPEVRRRAYVADDALARELPKESRVFHGLDAVRDPDGGEKSKSVRDGPGTAPLARVRDPDEARPPPAAERFGEIARGECRLVATEAEADDAPPGTPGLKIEDARCRRGSPVPHEIEQDPHLPAALRLVKGELALEGFLHIEPVEADPLHDRG